jgi:hypothetical protein
MAQMSYSDIGWIGKARPSQWLFFWVVDKRLDENAAREQARLLSRTLLFTPVAASESKPAELDERINQAIVKVTIEAEQAEEAKANLLNILLVAPAVSAPKLPEPGTPDVKTPDANTEAQGSEVLTPVSSEPPEAGAVRVRRNIVKEASDG